MKQVLKGLMPQLEVIYALTLRETRTRFGLSRLGYFWALLEPILFILMFWGIYSLLMRVSPDGMTLASFLATGFVPYILFRNAAGRAASAIGANKGLLFYPQVRPLDLVVARIVLEMATYAMAFAIIMMGEGLYEGRFEIDDPLRLMLGFGLAGALGGSLGMVLCSLSVFSESVDRVTGVLLRPLFWISGLFFTANSLPSDVRDLMLYNPVLHIVEIVRDGWHASYDAVYVDAMYPLAWIFVLSFFGLTLERVARRRLEVT